ncbi:MAG: O-antigen ligase family protein [Planctomycetota bacterium]
MKNHKSKTDKPKITFVSLLENILFVVCLITIVLRTTFTEAPLPQTSQIQSAIHDTVYSLALSGVLLFSLLLLFLIRLFTRRLSFKFNLMEIALVLLLIATAVATLYAPNKRAAINASLILLAPLLMVILLARLLDSHAKIKILLIVVASLGIVASWQSAEQFFVSNNAIIEQYKEDPNAILQPLGIQPGSLNHILLEHRIFSKDVRASFTTGNSAGSFAILASFAAVALLAELLKTRKSFPASSGNRGLSALIIAAVLFGLALTRSKGAIAAFLIALAVFALLVLNKKPKILKNIILAACVLAILTLIPLAAWFGLKFARLPGGNSMLVRWQYWHASAQMAADHPLTGVGPGNFACAYHQYKSPSAPETVSDPHCFFLSILTQYGPIGLLGFLLFVLVPMWRSSLNPSDTLEKPSGRRFITLAFLCIIVPAAAMLALRPFLLPYTHAITPDEKFYVLFNDFVAPVAAFVVGFALLLKSIQTITKTPNSNPPAAKDNYALQNTNLTAIAMFSGLLGVLIHNLIDFAIFEPGVLMTFCAILACLIALSKPPQPPLQPKLVSAAWPKITATAGFVVIGFAYFNYALLPVAKSSSEIAQAVNAIPLGQLQLAHNLLDAATQDDPLSPEAPLINAQLYLQYSSSPLIPRSQVFYETERALSAAISRNPADYKIFELMAELYSLRAQDEPDKKDQWFTQAFDAESMAVSLFPGDGDLHFKLAQLADELGKTDVALAHYEKTIQIEDGFREQFRLMNPGREVFSRLGEEKYSLAKQRIEELPK